MRAKLFAVLCFALLVATPVLATHEPPPSEPVFYDGVLFPSVPVVGQIGHVNPVDGYDWYSFNAVQGQQIQCVAIRTSGDLLLNLGLHQGVVADGQPIGGLPALIHTHNSSSPDVVLTYTPSFSGPVTLYVSTWLGEDGGGYNLVMTGGQGQTWDPPDSPSGAGTPQTGQHERLPKQPGDPCQDLDIHPNTPQGPLTHSQSLPVAFYNGEARLRAEDLRVLGRGLDFVWERTYSNRSHFSGHLGWNWHIRYNRRVQMVGPNATVMDGRGREDGYTGIGGGAFLSGPGFFDNLKKNVDGTFTQRLADGTRYEYRADGWLVTIADRNGNALWITRNAAGEITTIEDTQGRLYTFTYANGRITTMTDFAGRQVVYTYDGNGDLVKVRSPVVTGMPQPENNFPNGKTSLYTYTSGKPDPRLNHNLLTAVDPLYNINDDPAQSKAWVTLTYAAETNPINPGYDRVELQRWGHDQGGPPSNPNMIVGGTAGFAYYFTPDGDAPPGTVLRMIETDRNGNVTKHYFDATRHETKTVETMNRDVRPGEGPLVTTYSYSTEGFLLEKVLPRGNSVSYLYTDTGGTWRFGDGLLLEERRKDGPLGNAPDLVTHYTYEPVFQQQRSVTDPREFPDGIVPGNFDPLNSRYTILHLFDYQEGTGFQAAQGVPVALRIPEGLGDQNGAFDFDEGNIVKVKHPTIQTPGPNLGQTAEALSTWNGFGQPLSERDPEGTVTVYDYYPTNGVPNDPSDREGYLKSQRVDAAGFDLKTEYEYDTAGNITRLIDPEGHDTLYTVNTLNQVVRTLSPEVDTPGTFRYRIDTIWDANNEVIERRVLNLDETGAIQPNAEIIEQHERNILRYPAAVEREKTHNDNIMNAGMVRTEYFYDANMNRTAVKTPLAVSGVQPDNIVTTLYDERDLSYQVIRGDDDIDPANPPPTGSVIVTMNYDPNGNLLERIDRIRDNPAGLLSQFLGSAPGDVTRMDHDGFDRLVQVTDGELNDRDYAYDMASNRVRETLTGPVDETGAPVRLLMQTDLVFDERHRVVTKTAQHFERRTGNAIGNGASVMAYTYDRDSKTTNVQDDRGLNTATQWDTADRVSKVVDHLMNEVQYGYDNNGNVTSQTRRDVSTDLGTPVEVYVTTNEYDGVDRLKKTTDPAGDVREFFYDSRSNLVKTSDGVRGTGHPNGSGNTVLMDYDGLDRLVRTNRILTTNGRGDGTPVPAEEIVTLQGWDDNSRLVTQTDDNSHATTYGYDAKDRRVSETMADGTLKTWLYNEDDNNTQWMDANGTVCLHAYDGLNRLKSKTVNRGPGVLGATYETIGYDGASQATKIETDDLLGNVLLCRFEYDSMGNATKDQNAGVVDSVYDGVGNRTLCTYPGEIGGPGRRVFGIAYDGLNRMQTVSNGAGPIANWHYKGHERLERRTYGNDGAPISLTDCLYDSYPREIVKHHQTGAGGMIARFEYGYDREHHRLFEKRVHDGSLGDVYQYDSAYRVVRSPRKVDLSGVPAGTEIQPETVNTSAYVSYVYDGVQNRLKSTDAKGISSGGPPYAIAIPLVTAYARQAGAPTFDAEVNQYTQTKVNNQQPVTYLYDENGNLKSDGTKDFFYDFKNRLVQVSQTVGGMLVAQYSHDVANRRIMKLEPTGTTVFAHDGMQVVEERDGLGAITRQYVWGPGVDELLQEQTPTATYYAFENAIGSVCALAAPDGTIVERYQYDPFGNTTVTLNGNTGNRYRFHTMYSDAETGTHYARNRTYLEKLGRFGQRDPIGGWEDEGGFGNALAFSRNNAVDWRDVLGLAPGDTYATLDDAAKDAMKDIYEKSVKEDLEYGGELIKTKEGFTYKEAKKGRKHGVDVDTDCRDYAGYYHSHGAESGPEWDDENFSDTDKQIAFDARKPAYLVTPSGKMKKFTPGYPPPGPVTDLGKIDEK